ncbi:hypothetical protein QQX98_000070 [Neonectria punicea]|uniref:Uncharacterized protein n=1 Tax=Neonectria punicea TaxID=979145 RepID=A0ABR1HVU7_9HYPO
MSSYQDETNEEYIRQCFQRGHIPATSDPLPAKPCTSCKAAFRGVREMCVPCYKESYTREMGEPPSLPDTFLENCEKCNARTLHLGESWCVGCSAVEACATFSLICEECEIIVDVPAYVKDGCGGVVDILDVESLWCVKCGGIAESPARA